MEHPNYNNENIKIKYLNNMRKNQFLIFKNSVLELGKYFMILKDKELNDRELNIKREIK